MIIKTKKDVEKYIENKRHELLIERIQDDRYLKSFNELSADILLSNAYSSIYKIEKGTFDDYAISLKERTMLEMFEKYPRGIKVNEKGGMCPIEFIK